MLGWKEYELEVVRDLKDNVVIICSIENFRSDGGAYGGFDHRGAGADVELIASTSAMRDAAIAVIREIGVETGGSNVQFAVDPQNGAHDGD